MTSCAWEERRRREEAEKAKIEAPLRRHYGLELESCGSRGTPTEVRTMLAKACKDPFVGILFALVMLEYLFHSKIMQFDFIMLY